MLDFGKCLECEDPASGRDGLCSPCRGFRAAKENFRERQGPLYRWDESRDQRLRRCYDNGDRAQLSRALTRLAGELQFPKSALRRRAEQLGITSWSHVRWTEAELHFLAEHAGNKTVGWIATNLKRRTGVGRSYSAVKCKANEIGRSLRFLAGYSRRDLATVFGTTESTVAKWVGAGWLRLGPHGRASESAVIGFLRDHPAEWHFRRVDEAWVKGLLFPPFNAKSGAAVRAKNLSGADSE